MEAAAEIFGISWAKLLAQVIIFLAVYFILSKYAFGPILAILEKRRERIAEGEANLAKIKSDLSSAEEKAEEIISQANSRADGMISEARESAAAFEEKERQKAVAEAGKIIAKANEATELERERLLAELKRDFGRLVVDTTGKVTGKVLNDGDRQRINEETAGQIAL